MPKYTNDIIAGYVLYYTSKCTIEAMHVHASNKELKEQGSAKLWVYDNGDTKIDKWGEVKPEKMTIIREYIKANYKDMYIKWTERSKEGFYNKR